MNTKTLKIATVVILTSSITTGCANLGVKPWERDLLAKESMALNASPIDNALDDHIYFSKEATSGGRGFAAGGCGCN